ncbi:hypothetical protein Q31b_54350 [Novipirellula aureliae]|uniref:Uncharacterized protein n=1 Tax=Novipirellula aureliae TaxID=2527966 RepID=A0A5C6DKD1_9BACT|nr:hypothetical protein [Novipirellula aureliae]TWU35339.1 hypothetical protein Q31b_54350 [Novipirellula aureliae]
MMPKEIQPFARIAGTHSGGIGDVDSPFAPEGSQLDASGVVTLNFQRLNLRAACPVRPSPNGVAEGKVDGNHSPSFREPNQ